MLLHLATPAACVTLALIGVFFYGYSIFRSAGKHNSPFPSTANSLFTQWDIFVLILSSIALISYSTSIFWPFQYDQNDDWIAYLSFPEKILQTGTLIEPFSARRILSLCGQSFLLAETMVVAHPESAHLLDRGLGILILLGLMIEATREAPKRWFWLRFIIVLTVLTISVPRINTGTSLLGIALTLALLHAISRGTAKKRWYIGDSLFAALPLAAASSMRPTFAILGGGVCAVYFGWRALAAPARFRFRELVPLFQTGVLTFGLLLPYMILSSISSNTLMFPFVTGNAVPEFIYWPTKQGLAADISVALQLIVSPQMIVIFIGFLLSATLAGEARRLAISCSVVAFLLIITSSANISGTNYLDMYRFCFPLAAAPFFWILTHCLLVPDKEKLFSAPVSAGLAVAIFLCAHLSDSSKELQTELALLPKISEGFTFEVAQLKPSYDRLQSMVPEGEKIFAVVDAPYLLNYSRNTIDGVDVIAYASPPPRMPFHEGPEPLRKYLAALGYKYLLCVDFGNAVFLYSRKAMENHPRPEYREHARKYVLDFMNNVDAIADWNTIARDGNVRLIKL
jgi:hypothetical protein